jgi:bile acid:Na+ symporter, BASS family
MNMKTVLDAGVLGLIVLAMLSVGLELEIRYFRELAGRGFAFTAMLLMQMVLLPAVGLVISFTLDLSPLLRSGILLIAACPVGDIANFFTLIGRGNLAISVAMTAISCLISPLSMAIIFAAYGRILGTSFAFAAPGWALVLRFFFLIAVPIIAGMGLRFARIPNIDRFSRFVRFVCLLGILALCAFVIISRFDQLKADWKFGVRASAPLALVAMTIGWTASRALRMKRADRVAFLISFAVRNVGLAATIAITVMNRIEYAVVSMVYFLSEVALVLAAVVAFRLWAAKSW